MMTYERIRAGELSLQIEREAPLAYHRPQDALETYRVISHDTPMAMRIYRQAEPEPSSYYSFAWPAIDAHDQVQNIMKGLAEAHDDPGPREVVSRLESLPAFWLKTPDIKRLRVPTFDVMWRRAVSGESERAAYKSPWAELISASGEILTSDWFRQFVCQTIQPELRNEDAIINATEAFHQAFQRTLEQFSVEDRQRQVGRTMLRSRRGRPGSNKSRPADPSHS